MIGLLAIKNCFVTRCLGDVLTAAFDDWSFVHVTGAEDAQRRLAATNVGLAVLELALIDGDPRHWLRAAHRACPGAKWMVFADAGRRKLAFECLAAGAHAVIFETAQPADVVSAAGTILQANVRIVVEGPGGEGFFPAPADEIRMPSTRDSAAGAVKLTPRQCDVMHLLREGKSTKEIARELDLGIGTVKVHLARTYHVLGARNRTEAVVRAGTMLAAQ